jgi:hypothetical protein
MNARVVPLSLAFFLALSPVSLAAPTTQPNPPAQTQKAKPPAQKVKPPSLSKSVTVKREPSPWMKEAQRQKQVKAQERQKTINDIKGTVQKTDRDMHKNRASTSIDINKGTQQLLTGGGRKSHQTPPSAGGQAPANPRPQAPPSY